MNAEDIRRRHAAVIKPGYGTVTPDELGFIQRLIERHRPESFVEIGMASGISTGFIASFMDENGGRRLVSLDHDDTFFGDTSKPNGFLVPELYAGTRVALELVKFKTAPDIQDIAGNFDILAKFYLDREEDIGHFVGQKVQTIPGIVDTRTIITFKAF